jgi:RTX calcium-binding nonapeptide repeat (4 copies)
MSGRHFLRSSIAASLCVAAATALPAPARATVVELRDGRLAVADPDGVANVLRVRQLSLVEFEVYDEAGGLVSGVGCGLLSAQVARCAGNALGVRVDGGAGDDLLDAWGLTLPVELHGDNGADALGGGGGPDQLWGGAGSDSLSGAAGEDRVSAEEGDDFADGNGGADTVLGGGGDDVLGGQGGNGDLVTGGDGQDLIKGGAGNDQLEGGAGDDALLGGAGRDAIGTGLGNDVVFGGGGGGNQIDCRQGDRARGQAGPLPTGCAPLPALVPKPDAWPPEDDALVARRSQTVYRVFIQLFRPGAGERFWMQAGAAEDVSRKVRVKLTLWRGNTVLRRRCVSGIRTNKKIPRAVPRRARSVTRITGKVRRGAPCP